MVSKDGPALCREYRIFLLICLGLIAAAFIFDRPPDIISGMGRILVSRGLLLTDYMAIGGLGASLVNSALLGIYAVLLLCIAKAKPCGAAIMALWMAIGWSYWGANVFNVLPLTCGVALFCRYKKRPFSEFVIVAILGETIAPIVSLFYFSNPVMLHFGLEWPIAVNVLIGVSVGLICGFLLPVISAVASRMHEGFTLYNMGVAGGVIAMFAAAAFKAFGIDVPVEDIWYTGRRFEIAVFLYALFAALILIGLILGRQKKLKSHIDDMKTICSQTGHAPNDYYLLCGEGAYINMGLLGVIGTTVTLLLGADLNGAVFACIFSMVAFGCLGKHIYNVLPLMLGAIICAFLNAQDVAAPANILPILFATCLAPIAGKHGWLWGMAAGFLHVVITQHIGPVTNGMNLYNNGFASGIVAFFLVPIIVALKRTP